MIANIYKIERVFQSIPIYVSNSTNFWSTHSCMNWWDDVCISFDFVATEIRMNLWRKGKYIWVLVSQNLCNIKSLIFVNFNATSLCTAKHCSDLCKKEERRISIEKGKRKVHIIGFIRPFSTVNQKKIAYHFVFF